MVNFVAPPSLPIESLLQIIKKKKIEEVKIYLP